MTSLASRLQSPRHLLAAGGALLLVLAVALVGARVFADDAAPDDQVSAGAYHVAVVADSSSGGQRIVAIEIPGETRRELGYEADYITVRVSPDGQTIAALSRPQNDQLTLHFFDWQSGDYSIVALREASDFAALSWSPDSTMVGIVDIRAYLFDREGNLLMWADPAWQEGKEGQVSIASGGFDWSPSGQTLASIVNGRLILLARSGGLDVALSTIFKDPIQHGLSGWLGEQPVLTTATGLAAVGLSPAGETLATPVAAGDVTSHSGLRPFGAEDRARGTAVLPGGTADWARLSVDGSFLLVEVWNGDGDGRLAFVPISFDGEVQSAPLQYPRPQSMNGARADAARIAD